jgi:hypothetical protein
MARLDRIERALWKLTGFQEKLRSPRTRYRQRAKIEDAFASIIAECGAGGWVRCEIKQLTLEQCRQEHKGRPGKATRYVKRVATRFDITTAIDELRIAEDAICDGVFPLVTNVQDMTPLEVLHAYKRQPDVEKRFSQQPVEKVLRTFFHEMKTSGFRRCFAPGIASLRSARLLIHSLLAVRALPARGPLTPAPAVSDILRLYSCPPDPRR